MPAPLAVPTSPPTMTIDVVWLTRLVHALGTPLAVVSTNLDFAIETLERTDPAAAEALLDARASLKELVGHLGELRQATR